MRRWVEGGGGGSDRLYAGAGDDLLKGSPGADLLDGGAGTDRVSYAAAESGVRVNLARHGDNIGEATGDLLIGIEIVEGSRFADILIGDEKDNRLEGGAAGDFLQGGQGADALLGGDGRDTASYVDAQEAVRANLENSALNEGEAYGDTYDNIENLFGSSFGDLLNGDGNENTLDGYKGDDTLDGGTGDDTLDGGQGADRYVFRAREGYDLVHEQAGEENIIVFDSLADERYEADSFVFARLGDDLRITTNLANEVTLTDYYDEELSYRVFTQSSDGVLTEIAIDL